MWLEHIQTLIEGTDMENLYCDLPMAQFMIKLLSTRTTFDNFTNKAAYMDYVKSTQSIELRYFIQVTIKDEIEEECILKEKVIESEIKELYFMFGIDNVNAYPQTPSYEDRMLLYAKYIEGNDFNEAPSVDWTNKEVNFPYHGIIGRGPGSGNHLPWSLLDYYNYFRTHILNKDNVDLIYRPSVKKNNQVISISTYRYYQEKILNILNKFSNKESFLKLMQSILDVKVSKLMEKRDKDTLNY